MARRNLVGTGPASSTGSPTTLMMRPRHSSPTGTEIGCPVSVTSWPRTRPSEVSIATVRTVDSPRCWATSSTRRPFGLVSVFNPALFVSSAFRIAGRWPSNCTSTTAPMTWVIFPVATAMSSSQSKLKRLGAGDDLDQLLGDHRLARAVVGQRLLADHFAGVARRVVHRAHLRAVERGVVLEQRAEDLHGKILRQQLGQDVLFLRLVFVRRARTVPGFVREHCRDDLLR